MRYLVFASTITLGVSFFTAAVWLARVTPQVGAARLTDWEMSRVMGRGNCPGCTTSQVMDCYGEPACSGCNSCPKTDENWFNRTRNKCDTDPPENGAQCDEGKNNFPCYNLEYCVSGDDLPMQTCQNNVCVGTNDDLDDCPVCETVGFVPNSTGPANNDTCVSCGS